MEESTQQPFKELEKSSFDLDGKIKRFKNKMAKRNRREEKLYEKLQSFAKWLKFAEKEVECLEASNLVENSAKDMMNLRESCEKYQDLVLKLENTHFISDRAEEIMGYCRRYRTLVDALSQWKLHGFSVPVHLDEELPSTSGQLEVCSTLLFHVIELHL